MINLDDALKKMGKAWFLSFYVHDHYDHSDYTYTNPDNFYIRTLLYNATDEYHDELIKRVLKTSVKSLSKNTINISEQQIVNYLNLVNERLAA